MNFLNSVINTTKTEVIEESVSIDNFYMNSLNSFSNTIKNIHSNFINSQKSIFSSLTKDSSAAKGAICILDKKYDHYNDDLFGWLDKNSDRFTKFMLIYNKDVFSQAKIIEEYIKKKPMLGIMLFNIPRNIYFATSARITKQSTLFLGDLITGARDEDEIDGLWYMDKRTLIDKMEHEKIIYIEEGSKSAKEIIALFKSYQEDVKKYWKEYKENIDELRKGIEKHKKECENYIENKIPALKNKTEEEKEYLVKRYKLNIDTNIKMMQMITEHYKYQLKMMLQSLKEFSLVMQDIYDYVIENK